MTNLHGRIPTRGPEYQTFDKNEDRNRVAAYVDGNSVAYENTLTAGPDVLCNFFVDSGGRRAHYGYVINDGEGDIQLSWTFDGITYGGVHTLKQSEKIAFDGFSVQIVKLHHTGIDADYRMLLM